MCCSDTMEGVLMHSLYRGPLSLEDLLRELGTRDRETVRRTLSQLCRRGLVVNITKNRGRPLYKLNRNGKRVLEGDHGPHES